MANRWDQLIESWNPVLRKAFLDGVYRIRNDAQIEQIATALERGDVDGAIRAVGLDPAQFRVFDRAIEQAFEAGGIATATALPPVRDPEGLRVVFQFSVRNPAAEQWLRDHSSNAIREIVEDQRVMIREHLRAGMARGANPRTSALDLVGRIGANGQRQGGVIGLTSTQAEWVRRYAEELAGDNPAATLSRALRDKRFDRAVIKATQTGEPIPAALRAKMEASYRNRALRYRAETIARTESLTSLHQAQEQAMRQAVDAGAVQASTVSFIWRTARDNRVRDTHQSMEGQQQPMGTPFITGAGVSIRFPGDPLAPPSETIQCRCWREPRIDFLAGIR